MVEITGWVQQYTPTTVLFSSLRHLQELPHARIHLDLTCSETYLVALPASVLVKLHISIDLWPTFLENLLLWEEKAEGVGL